MYYIRINKNNKLSSFLIIDLDKFNFKLINNNCILLLKKKKLNLKYEGYIETNSG